MDMERIVARALLKGIVAKKIFCDKTGKVLDVRNAVMAEINYVSGRASYIVVVAEAWPDIQARIPKIEKHPAVSRIDVYDGRELFGKVKKEG